MLIVGGLTVLQHMPCCHSLSLFFFEETPVCDSSSTFYFLVKILMDSRVWSLCSSQSPPKNSTTKLDAQTRRAFDGGFPPVQSRQCSSRIFLMWIDGDDLGVDMFRSMPYPFWTANHPFVWCAEEHQDEEIGRLASPLSPVIRDLTGFG